MTSKVALMEPLPPLFLPEETLDENRWMEDASSFIEEDSYLPAACGQEVVFVKAGYSDHCEKVRIPAEAQWTSFEQRRRQTMDHNVSKALLVRLGLDNLAPGPVERCKITKITYHRRLVPGSGGPRPWTNPTRASERSAPQASASSENAAGQIDPAAGETSAEEASDEDESSDDEEEPLARMFVRLTLQRLPRNKERGGPVSTTIDHYVDGGASEWLVPRRRFERSAHRPWRRNDRIQMFWQDKNANGGGQLWHGVVVEAVKRGESPWAGVRIRWDDVEEEDYVSPWELQRSMREEDSEAASELEHESAAAPGLSDELSSDDEWKEADDESWSGGGKRRRRRGSSREGHHGERARKRSRLDAAGENMLETMVPRSSTGRVDWNRGHCALCMQRPRGEDVVECDGTCTRSFHEQCLSPEVRPAEWEADAPWYCSDCRAGVAECACCKLKGVAGQEVVKCRHGGCGQYFHHGCLRMLATTACLKIHSDKESGPGSSRAALSFSCPWHFCSRCHLSGDALKLYHCWTCINATHSKCLDRGEVKLNEKEMECRDCIAARKQIARPDNAINEPVVPRRSCLASLTDLKSGRKVELKGKEIFHIGSHTKGGGCDFIIPLEKCKFHSQLRILSDGNATLGYCHKGKKMAKLEVRRDESAVCEVSKTQPLRLKDGDVINIAEHNFRYSVAPFA